MPIPLSPSDTYELVLRGDQRTGDDGEPLPADQQPADLPTFAFRVLNGREQRVMAGMMDEVEEMDDAPSVIDKWFEILRFVLAGWRNLRDPRNGDRDVPYDAAKLEDVLTFQEARELVYRAFGHAPTADDLGKFASPSSSASGGSAAATAERA